MTEWTIFFFVYVGLMVFMLFAIWRCHRAAKQYDVHPKRVTWSMFFGRKR